MKSLLVVAHGSRRQASNDEVRTLILKLREQANVFAQIDCAFLELAEPSIPNGLRQLIKRGATDLIVLPYFLSAGRHVVEHIPAEIEIVRQEYPKISILLVPHLGAADGITTLLLKQSQLFIPSNM